MSLSATSKRSRALLIEPALDKIILRAVRAEGVDFSKFARRALINHLVTLGHGPELVRLGYLRAAALKAA